MDTTLHYAYLFFYQIAVYPHYSTNFLIAISSNQVKTLASSQLSTTLYNYASSIYIYILASLGWVRLNMPQVSFYIT
jgi:hypothetical protein